MFPRKRFQITMPTDGFSRENLNDLLISTLMDVGSRKNTAISLSSRVQTIEIDIIDIIIFNDRFFVFPAGPGVCPKWTYQSNVPPVRFRLENLSDLLTVSPAMLFEVVNRHCPADDMFRPTFAGGTGDAKTVSPSPPPPLPPSDRHTTKKKAKLAFFFFYVEFRI